MLVFTTTFRRYLHVAACLAFHFLQEGDSTQALELSLPVGLLTLALDFATAEAARSTSLNKSIAALPMVLLEDFLESQVRRRLFTNLFTGYHWYSLLSKVEKKTILETGCKVR